MTTAVRRTFVLGLATFVVHRWCCVAGTDTRGQDELGSVEVTIQSPMDCRETSPLQYSMSTVQQAPSHRGVCIASMTDGTTWSAETGVNLSPRGSFSSYQFKNAVEGQTLFDTVEDNGLAAAYSYSIDESPKEQDTPLLVGLRSVLAAIEERSSQDSYSAPVGCEVSVNDNVNGDADRQSVENSDDTTVGSEHRATHRSSSASIFSEDELNELDAFSPTVNDLHGFQSSLHSPTNQCDPAVQPPPRGGIASCYRAIRRYSFDMDMSRYMMNTSTRVPLGRSHCRIPNTTDM